MSNKRIPVSVTDVKRFIVDIYGFQPVEIRPFSGGFDDANFYVKHENGIDEFVLKILNSRQSREPSQTVARVGVMNYLVDCGIRAPKIIQTKHTRQFYTITDIQYQADGKTMNEVESNCSNDSLPGGECGESGRHLIWLQNYILGIAYDSDHVETTLQLYFEIGKFASSLHKHLLNCADSLKSTLNVIGEWSLMNVVNQRYLLKSVRNIKQRELLDEIVTQFERVVVPQLARCRASIVHGDLNDENLLLTRDNSDRWRLECFIDYGDCIYSYTILDIAIAIMYFTCFNKGHDIFDIVRNILAGYLSNLDIAETDRSVLRICICARYAQSLMMGINTFEEDKTKTYALKIPTIGWSRLEKLWNATADEQSKWWP
ncbi:hydroxylysine kinase-like [Tubulanus polymorphus]|uniref:hydroxylysine kinase-like n=1 Tax=Tubulanus polymorphus TaxID=672921 RepID=UPI003DA4FF4F